jgi:hypothetical protein
LEEVGGGGNRFPEVQFFGCAFPNGTLCIVAARVTHGG